jgi:hypothetical protein
LTVVYLSFRSGALETRPRVCSIQTGKRIHLKPETGSKPEAEMFEQYYFFPRRRKRGEQREKKKMSDECL